MEVLTIDSTLGERVLPVFGDEEEASTFLRGRDYEARGWRARPTGIGELASVLSGPCAEVSRVVFDPWPEMMVEEAGALIGIGRISFLESLLGRGRSWSERISGGAPAQPRGEEFVLCLLRQLLVYGTWLIDTARTPTKADNRTSATNLGNAAEMGDNPNKKEARR